MDDFICWICGQNRSDREYQGKDLLDEDGTKPCLECIIEAEEDNSDNEF